MPDRFPVVRGSQLPTRGGRQLGRSLARLQANTSFEVAQVRAAEAIEVARIEAIGSVSTIALMETSNLAVAEAVLAQRAPHAAGRLQYVAETGTFAMTQVVAKLDRSLR
jgi:hypothetical protein